MARRPIALRISKIKDNVSRETLPLEPSVSVSLGTKGEYRIKHSCFDRKAPLAPASKKRNVSRETFLSNKLINLNKIIFNCKYCSLCTISYIKLLKNTRNMILNCSLTNFHFFCNISIELSYCYFL